MFHLYSPYGTLVFVDDTSGLLRHGPIAEVPANLVAERQGGTLALLHVGSDGARRPVTALGAERCGVGPETLAPRPLNERRRGAMRSSLAADGRFLAAEADGSLSFTRSMAFDQDSFLLLTAENYADLHALLANRWVTASAHRVLLPGEITALPQFAIRIRQADHDLETLLGQLRPPGAAALAERGTVMLRSDGWQLDWLHLYRPLAYLTVFGSDEHFACALVTIGSLLRVGRWPGDILAITDTAHQDFAKALPAEIAARVHVAAVQADDPMDRAFARFRIADLAVAERYQPMLHLGDGVVCDAPLDGLMAGLALSDRLHALPEGPLLGADETYGRTLFLRDNYAAEGNAIGFSTAMLGFRSVRDVRELFATIIACGYGFAEQEQARDFFALPDQAFANYVLHKVGVFDLSLIYACRSAPPSPTGPGAARGLLRFVAADGNAGLTLSAMRGYLEQIAARAA